MPITDHLPPGTEAPSNEVALFLQRHAGYRLDAWAAEHGYLIDKEHPAWADTVSALAALWHTNGVSPADQRVLMEREVASTSLGSASIRYDDTSRAATIRRLIDDVPGFVAAILRPALRRKLVVHPFVYG